MTGRKRVTVESGSRPIYLYSPRVYFYKQEIIDEMKMKITLWYISQILDQINNVLFQYGSMVKDLPVFDPLV